MDITYYKYGIGGYAAFDGSKVPLPPQGDPFVKYQVWPYNGFVPIDAINGSPTPFSVDFFAAGMQLDASDMRVTVKKNGVPVPSPQFKPSGGPPGGRGSASSLITATCCPPF